MVTNPIVTDNPVYQEEHYAAPVTTRLARAADALLPARPGVLAVVVMVIVAGAVRLGWLLRELSGMPYDYHQLAWLVPLACLLVTWGNRRAA